LREFGWLVWTAVFWGAFALINSTWLEAVPRIKMINSSTELLKPKSKVYEGFTITCRGETWQGRWTSGRTHLVLLQQPNRQLTMTINMVDSSYRCTLPGGRAATAGVTFSAKALRAWVTDAGIDVTAPGVSREVDEVVAHVNRMASGGISFSGAFDGGSTGSSRRARAVDWISFVRTMAAFVWISGLLILRRAARAKA
jgi:hypothetical protein